MEGRLHTHSAAQMVARFMRTGMVPGKQPPQPSVSAWCQVSCNDALPLMD